MGQVARAELAERAGLKMFWGCTGEGLLVGAHVVARRVHTGIRVAVAPDRTAPVAPAPCPADQQGQLVPDHKLEEAAGLGVC